MSTGVPKWLTQVRVIGFDLDQTLYPKSPLIDEKIQGYLYEKIADACSVSLQEARHLFRERYKEGAGMSGRETLIDLGLPDAEELVQEALERADIASVLVPDLETYQLLEELHTRYRAIDLITGSQRSEVEKKLAALELPISLFSFILTADESKKSTGESYRLWLAHYPDLKPSQFLYVGDRARTDHDIPATLGICTALVQVKNPNLQVDCPQYTSLRELLQILLN